MSQSAKRRSRDRQDQRYVPSDLQMEQALLASLLTDPNRLHEVRGVLRPADLVGPGHGQAFAAMLEIHKEGATPDVATLLGKLNGTLALIELGGAGGIAEWHLRAPTPGNAGYYAEQLADLSLRRQVMSLAQDVVQQAAEPNARGMELLENFGAQLQNLSRHSPAAMVMQRSVSASDLLSMSLPPVRCIVDGLLVEGLAILAAPPKAGKSWMAMNLAAAVSSGSRALGSIPCERGDVLYLALEDSQRRLQTRLSKVLRDAAPPEGLDFWTELPRLDCGGSERIAAWIGGHPNARLVIVDTLGRVAPPRKSRSDSYLDDYQLMAGLKQLADHAGVAMVLIHHTRKAEARDFLEMVSGTMGLTGAADTVLVLQRNRTEKTALLHVTGRDVEEQALRLEWNDDSGLLLLRGKAEPSESDRVAQIIYSSLLSRRPAGMTVAELHKLFQNHLSSERMQEALSMLEKEEKIHCEEEVETGGRPAKRWFAK